MKVQNIKLVFVSLFLVFLLPSCSDFEEMNVDPNAADAEAVMPEMFLNNSMVGAQMNPDTAERSFILYWKVAGRQMGDSETFAVGGYNDGWTSNYWNDLSNWLKYANLAITVGKEKEENGTASNYNDNVIQIARIWRAYVMSELSDNWGPAPIEGFQGVNPDFDSVEDVYNYILNELKEAVPAIDPNITGMPDNMRETDVAYEMDWEKWQRYGNSLRMRLAMRLSEVDPSTAQSHFEDAVSGGLFIKSLDENLKFPENNGWDGLTGVMTRVWNSQTLSETENNLMIGLGGIKSQDQLDSYLHSHIKAENYIGLHFPDQYPTKTNDPYVGYFFDGLQNKIDPRAYVNFYIPGDKASPNFSTLFEQSDEGMIREMRYADGSKVEIDTKFTWSTSPIGDYGVAGGRNDVAKNPSYTPALGQQFRSGTNERVFFGSWESYFLIAEAALRGWNTPLGDEEAYEMGIKESFEYSGVSQFYDDYKASTEYNRNGTSVKYADETEPPSSRSYTFKNGKTKSSGTVTINFPVNNLYKDGNVRNDKLTKIITQKFIANTPWLPLETWSDHRRLGLPFFENPAAENSLPNMPGLNSNPNVSKVEYFPQRQPYPSGFRNSDPEGYNKAVQLLGGEDAVLTPLWWAKH